MKAIISLLLALFVCFSSQAQDPQLFENNWYLDKLILNEVEYERPYENFQGLLYLSPDELNVWHQSCDEGFGTLIQYDALENVFNIDDGGVAILGNCVDPDTLIFMAQHYSFYLIDNYYARNPFAYILETVNDHISLTVINADGDQAIYGDQLLTVTEMSKQAISIYPNPVSDILNIEINPTAEIQSLEVYNLLGELILAKDDDLNQLDVSSLNSGVYFLKIVTAQGVLTKKILKK